MEEEISGVENKSFSLRVDVVYAINVVRQQYNHKGVLLQHVIATFKTKRSKCVIYRYYKTVCLCDFKQI
jgi:hypothetical protein